MEEPAVDSISIKPAVQNSNTSAVPSAVQQVLVNMSVPTNALASDPGVKYTPVEEKVEDTAHVAKSLVTPSNLFEFRLYIVSRPVTMTTFTARKTIYHSAGDEAMTAVISRNLERIQWIQLMAWNNDTDGEHKYEYEYSTGLTITQGSEVVNGFSLGVSYEGMSIGLEHSTRTFKSTETTSTKTTTVYVTVPPRSQLIFYQKRFDFRDFITFINDAWGQEWNIGPWGGYNPLTTKVTDVNIMAEEYFTRDAVLPEGPGLVTTVEAVAHGPKAGQTRRREDVTQRARNMLVSMGV